MTAIHRITYGIGPVIIPGHGPRMKDGKVVIPATEPKTVDAGFALTDAADISAIVTCLRSKSIQITRMVARRALKLSDGTNVDADINEEIVSRTWSGNPGFRIYLKDGKGSVLIQGLLSIGEYADFENAELHHVMHNIAERLGDRPEHVFRDY